MNSLKGRLLIILVGAVVAVSVIGCAAFAYLRWNSTREESLRSATQAAEGAANALTGLMGGQADHERVAAKIAQGFARSHDQGSMVVFGRSGKVFGAVPSRQAKADYAVDSDCKVCHLSSASRKLAVVDNRADGRKMAMAVAPITAEAGCRQCHTSSAKYLGFVMVQLPVEELDDAANHDVIVIGSLLSFVGVAILFAAFLMVDRLVLSPMGVVFNGLRKLDRGGMPQVPHGRLPEEMEGLFDQFIDASRRMREVSETAPKLADSCAEESRALGARVVEVRERAKEQLELVGQVDRMMAKLADEVRGANSSVDLIAASSEDNAQNLSELTQSVSRVASDTEQLSVQVKRSIGSVMQMTRSVQAVSEHVDLLAQRVGSAAGKVTYIENSANEIAENARQASNLSGEMANSAIVGADSVSMISDSIKTSYQEIVVAADSMRKLKLASRSVGDILKIINEINDKTKLLALNAAIIAAQAGEQGRSFAVVAHEIKGLSDRTASSTGDIARIIDAIQESVEVALGNVSRGEERIGDSVEAVALAGSLLAGISQTASEASNKTRLITEATRRQIQLTSEVSDSVGQVAGAVEEIRRRVKEHGASANLLEEAAQAMSALTDQVRSSTKEQADGARHLSEAFMIIDVHLKGVVKAVSGNENVAAEVLAQIDQAKGNIEFFAKCATDAEKILEELKANLARLGDSVSDRGGVRG